MAKKKINNPIPASSGVYVVIDLRGRSVYIGASWCMRSRVSAHFSGIKHKKNHFPQGGYYIAAVYSFGDTEDLHRLEVEALEKFKKLNYSILNKGKIYENGKWKMYMNYLEWKKREIPDNTSS